jgi:PPIC-type PPIASE domain/SurA-like N-terminal domain
MKHPFSICAVILSLSLSLSAQVRPSHASGKAASQASADSLLKPTGRAVARVNGAVLTDRDLLREMYAIFPYAQQHGGGFPKSMEADIRQGALRMIEFEELVYQEAQRRKMTIPTARLDKAERDFRGQFHSPEEYNDFLKTEFKGSRVLLRQKIRRSLLIDKCLQVEIADHAKVSLAEAKTYYDKNPSRFEHPETFSFQSISILPPQHPTDQSRKEARKRADEALRQAKATKDYEQFGLLAEKISDDDFRVTMGDHKAVARTALPPEIAQAAAAMQPGQVSNLIQLGEAYTIFRLNAHTPAGKASFEDVKNQLIVNLQKTKYQQLRADLNQKLRKSAKVEEL